MSVTADSDLVTVAEAADLLKASTIAIHR